MKNPPPDSEVRVRVELALSAAHKAGDLVLRWFQRADLEIDTKTDGSPVTQADRSAEELLRAEIERAFPGEEIVGEEFGTTTRRAGAPPFRWILDPIDGTLSFAAGVPLFGTLIGIERISEDASETRVTDRSAPDPAAPTPLDSAQIRRAEGGVIHMPALGESVFAARGHGAHWIRRAGAPRIPARVSATPELERALFCTTSDAYFDAAGVPELYGRLRRATAVQRGWSDCWGHLLVATGRVDVMVDPVMSLWDCAALQPVVEEAGGRFTDLAGRETMAGGSAISSNGALHADVLALARDERPR